MRELLKAQHRLPQRIRPERHMHRRQICIREVNTQYSALSLLARR